MMLAPIADRFFTKSLDLRQPYPKRSFVAVIRRLNYGNKRGFAGGTPAPFSAHSFSARVGIVNLYAPGNWLGAVALKHNPHEFMFHFPGRIIIIGSALDSIETFN
jgi:hypothetical protein